MTNASSNVAPPAPSQGAASQSENVVRSAGVVSIAVFMSRITGLMRESIMAHLFGAGLIYALEPLSDGEKRIAIQSAARARGMPLSDEFVDHLLNHFQRDMRSLMGLIDALDRYSLAAKRAVTLPLLRELLHHAPPAR